jgi:hypothetical protein
MTNEIHEKENSNPLTEEQKASNRQNIERIFTLISIKHAAVYGQNSFILIRLGWRIYR